MQEEDDDIETIYKRRRLVYAANNVQVADGTDPVALKSKLSEPPSTMISTRVAVACAFHLGHELAIRDAEQTYISS